MCVLRLSCACACVCVYVYVCVCVCVCVCVYVSVGAHGRHERPLGATRGATVAGVSYEEEDTCVAYEEEDTFVSHMRSHCCRMLRMRPLLKIVLRNARLLWPGVCVNMHARAHVSSRSLLTL